MKYTFCEKLMWHALTPTLFQWLKRREPGWDLPALKRESKRIFGEMVERTPEIGSMKENSLRVCLSAGIVWLSVYEAAGGRMDEACFGEMVQASMEAPLVKGSFRAKAKIAFTRKAQQKRAENAKRGNARADGPFHWKAEVELGRDADEYTIRYSQCGLCALGKQEGLERLIPYTCALDILSVAWMGGVLYRTKTLATGGDCCDFYICRKGSKWEKEREEADGKA